MDVSGTYRGRIGAYQNVSGHIKIVRILRYTSWSIGCVSDANHTRTHIEYVSNTGYVGKMANLGNPEN
jgi:hypothetical protein